MSTATVENKARKGHYVAAIDGTSGRYGLERTFEKGVHVKARGTFKYQLAAGWYERQTIDQSLRVVCEHCGAKPDGKVREYFAVTPAGQVETLPASAAGIIDRISAGPLPGEPGTWNGAACHCGADVDTFDGDGFPYCDTHAPIQSTDTDTEGLVA